METKLTRNEKKKESTKALILETAIEMFSEKGFRDTKIKDITEKIDIGYGTFYQYFSNKDELLEYIMEDLSNQTVAFISEFSYKGLNMRERMYYAVYDILYFLVDRMPIIRAIYAAPMSQGQSRLVVLWEKLYAQINNEYEIMLKKNMLNENITQDELIVFFWMMKGVIEGLIEDGCEGRDIEAISRICGDMHYMPSIKLELQQKEAFQVGEKRNEKGNPPKNQFK